MVVIKDDVVVAAAAKEDPVSSAPLGVVMMSTVTDPLLGLLVLNSRHFAPSTIIIFETAILGFRAAIRGLRERQSL